MRVALFNLEPKIENSAMMQVSQYHKLKGDQVEPYSSLFHREYDRIYCFSIFQFTSKRSVTSDMVCGGTGFNVNSRLPPEIEACDLDYSVFPKCKTSYLWFSRGCLNKCPFCLTPDSLVITSTRAKPISEVQIGDLVLTHTGHYQPVLKIMSKHYEGLICKPSSGAGSNVFETWVTPEHPLFTRHVSYRSGGQLLTSFAWIQASLLHNKSPHRSREQFAYPRLLEIIDINEKDNFPISIDMMPVLGFYVAEGHLSNSKRRGWHRTTFSFGKNLQEFTYASEVAQLCNKLGIRANLHSLKTGWRITIDRVGFTRWLLSNFGTGSKHKHIALWFKRLPNDKLEAFLLAYLRGDGWYNKRKQQWTAVTVSAQLSLDLREIALKLGYTCTIRRRKSSVGHIEKRLVRNSVAYDFSIIKKVPRKSSVVFDKKYVYSYVLESSTRNYTGLVYNLEVAIDNSYCTPFFCVHNCVVPVKEGDIKPVQPKNLNPKGEYVSVMDNSFFANPIYEEAVNFLVRLGQPVLFHQGIDVRLFNNEQGEALKKLTLYKQLHVAWDNPREKEKVLRGIQLLTEYVPKSRVMCYVLIGYWSTGGRTREESEDLDRVLTLDEMGIDPYVMPFNKFNPYQAAFARWVNAKQAFHSVDWEHYKHGKWRGYADNVVPLLKAFS